MVTLSDYIKNISSKTLDSIIVIENLDDNTESLQILKVEMKHINGYLTIIIRKLGNRDNISDLYSDLLKLSISYLNENDFFRELEQINEIYSNDPNRIKNIKKLIINSFHKKGIVSILNEIQMN